MTAKDKLPRSVPDGSAPRYNARESWRIFGIMAEFVEATERLAAIRPAVSIFGSARTPPDHMYYILAEQIARLLSDSGFAVISGGGPGIMEAANKGGFGTLDELLEAMTLVQTKKSRRIPIILVHGPFWQGLLDWLRDRLVAEGMINREDLDLVQVIDRPEDVVEAIFKHYERRGFQPLPAEREMMLNL